tara:strand:+ start:5872 stop:6402 length:531 start_codon:yes stop_codon:yes gene_type:complete
MNKKGAVELSMTTIIIIVIGITILSLGLVWIRAVFTDVGGLTESAFEQGQTEINEIFGGTDRAVALSPSELSMKQGETSTATLAINNLGSGSVTVSASVEAIASGGSASDTFVCAFSDTFSQESNSYTLGSGDGLSGLKLLVEDQGSDLGTYICSVTVSGLADGTEISSVIVTLEK